MRFRVLLVVATTLAPFVVTTRDARAVGTRSFELDSIDKLSGGDMKGVSVGSDGVVRAGWTLGNVPFPADAGTTATCAAALPDGSLLVGTGPASGGKVVRIAGDQARVWADTGESSVNAIATDGRGNVYAATTSNKVYRITSGRADVFATLKDVDSVYALVADKSGALYAGTGSQGTVVRIEPNGSSSVYFQTSEPFVVSLAIAEDGSLYAGTSGKALLYHVTAPGRATVLYNFPGEDVHAIAVGPDRTVWAISNELSSNGSSESADSSARRTARGRTPPGPAGGSRDKPGKGSLWRFDAQGRPERVMHHDDFHYLSLALDGGAPYVGTGAEGRVYTVDDAHVVSLVADTDERQIGALGVAGALRYAVGSDPAVLHRVLSVGGPEAVWTSKPLDAGLRARFGRVTWNGMGALEVSTRSGDTQTPDPTWSDWKQVASDGARVASPPGRFFQLRARLSDASSRISDITVAFVTENLRAVVTQITAQRAGHEGKEGLVQSGAELPKHESVVHLSWKVDNPDGDELRYRLAFRREGGSRWVEATRPRDVLTRTEYDWDTSSLPEGRYRVRVEASDEMSNPPGEVTSHSLERGPILVDNTPPVIQGLSLRTKRLRAQIVDGLGPIARVEVALDGRLEWRPLAPVDGIFDSADETIDVDLAPLWPAGGGPHIVALRAYDAAGNAVVREVEVP